jgi:hypothetical protein
MDGKYQGRRRRCRCRCSTPAFQDPPPILPDIPDRSDQIRRLHGSMIPDSTLQFRPLTVTALHAMHALFITWPTLIIHLSSTVNWTEVPTLLCTLQSIHKQTHRIAQSIIMSPVSTVHCTHTTPTHLCGAGYIHEPPPLPDAMLNTIGPNER